MQTLDVQKEMLPVQYTEAVQSSNSDKKTAKEPERKGTTFLEMIKKIAEEVSDNQNTAEKIQSGATGNLARYEKTAGAKQTEFVRLKTKGGQEKNNAQTCCTSEPALDLPLAYGTDTSDFLLSHSEKPIALKNIYDFKIEEEQQDLFMQIDSEIVTDEEAALLLAERNGLLKKQKNEKTMPSGHETVVHRATVRNPAEDKTDHTEYVALEKSTKAQATKQAKPVFTVVDERTVQLAPVVSDGSVHEAGSAVRVVDTHSIDMVMDFNSASAGFEAKSEGNLFAKESSGQPFAALFAQHVQDMASDFVQAGKIVLQDHNAGIIRLQLQPAHLGNIRINLELTGDKKIAGKIIASSKEAYQAFKESIGQLAEAFEQGGFAAAQFDVSWSGESGGQQFAEGDSSFNGAFIQNEQVEVMQHTRYADTEIVYSFDRGQTVSVFA